MWHWLWISDKPGIPVDLRVAGFTETTVSLSWSPPSDNGGSEITKYVIERREASKRAWQTVGDTIELLYEVTSLQEGQTYLFRVAAVNDVGQGEFAELSQAVAPKSQHGKQNHRSLQFGVIFEKKCKHFKHLSDNVLFQLCFFSQKQLLKRSDVLLHHSNNYVWICLILVDGA